MYTLSQLESLYSEYLFTKFPGDFIAFLKAKQNPKVEARLMKDCPNAERVDAPRMNPATLKWESNFVYLCNASICTCIDNLKNKP